jgi:Fic family protein
MSYTDKRKQADLLQQKISAHGELSADVKKKINYKFRLDWNYYSNSMEGNTLTMDETRSVMVGNLTVGGKPIKDVLEMKGHDEVIMEILKIGKGEMRLSEQRIKEIHRGIMHEEDESKRPKIGEWKTEPNYIYNYKNERFDFVQPAEVPERMHQLLNKTNAAIDAIRANKKDAPHPLDVALQFHLEYVVIHPFYDGNGRTARILTNLLLISFGYPPFWVKTNERSIYNQYIGDIQGYGGNPDLFYEFATTMILRSQQLVVDAIEGKDIEEPDDMDKKLALLEKELEAIDPNEEIKKEFSKEVLFEIYDSWFTQLMNSVVPVVQKFNKFFTGNRHWISIQNGSGSVQFVNEPAAEILEKLKQDSQRNNDRISYHDCKLVLQTGFGPFIKGGLNSFGCNYGFEIRFGQIKYEVFVDEFAESQRSQIKLYERLLHKPLTQEEIDRIVRQLGDTIYQHIDYHTKKSGLR